MANWTPIDPARIEPEKPMRATDIWAISQNITAVTEGAINAPKIQSAAVPDVIAGDRTAYYHGNINNITLSETSTMRIQFGAVRKGTLRFSFGLLCDAGTPIVPTTIYARWYKNGTAVGSMHTIQSTTGASGGFADDISVVNGDVLEIRTSVENDNNNQGSSYSITGIRVGSSVRMPFLCVVRTN